MKNKCKLKSNMLTCVSSPFGARFVPSLGGRIKKMEKERRIELSFNLCKTKFEIKQKRIWGKVVNTHTHKHKHTHCQIIATSRAAERVDGLDLFVARYATHDDDDDNLGEKGEVDCEWVCVLVCKQERQTHQRQTEKKE